MAKISSYADGGDPQAVDKYVIARSGNNLSLLWATIKSFLDTVYASVADSVTNGNSHDHNGGDGAQIDHTTLSFIGTNTHAQIDTHIALPRWTVVKKTADTIISEDVALNNDSDLTFSCTANKTYAVRGKIWFDTAATPDFKYRFAFLGTSMWVLHVGYPAGSITPTITNDSVSPGATVSLLGATVGGYIEFDALLVCDGSARNLLFQWAQATSSLSETTVKAGSYIEYVQVD